MLALQGAFALHQRMLEALDVETIQVRTPAELDRADALVMPGGESSTMSMMLARSGLLDPLRARLDDGMVTFGTCAGAILLGREILDGRPDQVPLGAIDVDVRRNAFGRQVDSFEADLPVTTIAGDPFHAVFIRAPVVERAGDGVDVLASVGERPVLARQGHVLVSSFHPELTADGRLHRYFLEEVA